MELERRTLRLCALALVCAVALRLASGGAFGAVVQAFSQPELASFLLYMETGRVVRPAEPMPPTSPSEDTAPSAPPQTAPTVQTDPPGQTLPPTQTEPPQRVVFTARDTALVQVRNYCGYALQLEKWLTQPLDWDLTSPEPTVLIFHSHACESYTKTTEEYTEDVSYRTRDKDYNMVSIGDRIAELLEAGGITVIHDRELHDYPSYNDAYNQSRKATEDYLAQYPSIRLVLDIHRDAIESGGKQLGTTVTVDGQKAAQLMLVMGTNAGGQNHPDWEQNMALAVKLHAQLEMLQSGICRPISFRSSRFNQDVSTGAVLVEVGAAGNTREQALLAAQILAQAILALAHGAGE